MAWQSWEIALIIVAVILLFGASAIPKIARSMGRAKGEFARARKEFDAEARKAEGGAGTTGAPADEQAVRRSARELGIDEAGKPLAEVRRLIEQKLG